MKAGEAKCDGVQRSFGSYLYDAYNIGCEFFNLLKKSIKEGSLLEWRDTPGGNEGETKELPEIDEEPCRVAYIDPVFQKVCDPIASAIVKCGEMIDKAKPAQTPKAPPVPQVPWSKPADKTSTYGPPIASPGMSSDSRRITIDLRPFQKRAPEPPSSPEVSLKPRVAPAAPAVIPVTRPSSGPKGYSGSIHHSRSPAEASGYSVTGAGASDGHQGPARYKSPPEPQTRHEPAIPKPSPAHDLSSFYKPKPFQPSALHGSTSIHAKHDSGHAKTEIERPHGKTSVHPDAKMEPTEPHVIHPDVPSKTHESESVPAPSSGDLSGREMSDLQFIPKRRVAQLRRQWPPPSNAEGADYEREIFNPKPKDEQTVYVKPPPHIEAPQHGAIPIPTQEPYHRHKPTEERTQMTTTKQTAIPMPPPAPLPKKHHRLPPAQKPRAIPQVMSISLPCPKPFHSSAPMTMPRGRHESDTEHLMHQFDNINETFVPGRRADMMPVLSSSVRSRTKARSVEPSFYFNRAPKPWKPTK